MTTDRRHKQAARARTAATGEPYVLARRRIGPADGAGVASSGPSSHEAGVGQARAAQLAVAQELRRRGWPVDVEERPANNQWLVYAGPAQVGIGRDEPYNDSSIGDDDPDDGEAFDQSAPLVVHLCAPHMPEGGRLGEFDTELFGPVDAVGVVDTVARMMAHARKAGLAAVTDTVACALCGDRYPESHLLAPWPDDAPLCPACIFDGDLGEPAHVAYLAHQIDLLLNDDLTAPAGWAAVGVLLTALGPPDFAEELEREWRAAGSFFVPLRNWTDPGRWWCWVGATRGPLGRLRPGTSTARLAEIFDHAEPGRRRHVEREFQDVTGQRLSARLWTAAVAYVVALDTQARDRSRHRGPWHVLESFEAIPYSWEVDDITIPFAIDGVRKAYAGLLQLGWDDYLHSDDPFDRRGLVAANRFADLCEAQGWESVHVDDTDTDTGQALRVDAVNHMGAYALAVTWDEDVDGGAKFAGAVLTSRDHPGPTWLRTLAEAKRYAEMYGHGTDPATHPYVPERDGTLAEWQQRRGVEPVESQ